GERGGSCPAPPCVGLLVVVVLLVAALLALQLVLMRCEALRVALVRVQRIVVADGAEREMHRIPQLDRQQLAAVLAHCLCDERVHARLYRRMMVTHAVPAQLLELRRQNSAWPAAKMVGTAAELPTKVVFRTVPVAAVEQASLPACPPPALAVRSVTTEPPAAAVEISTALSLVT